MAKLLGADHVMLYGASNCSQDVHEAIKFYEDSGFLHNIPWEPPVPSLFKDDVDNNATNLNLTEGRLINRKNNCLW